MVSKERLEEITEDFERVIYPAEVGEMARELLALKSLPAMAEVDALHGNAVRCLAKIVMNRGGEDGSAIDGVPSGIYQKLRNAIDAMNNALRRAIASALTEKVRGDEAEKNAKNLLLQQEPLATENLLHTQRIADLTRERDELKGWISAYEGERGLNGALYWAERTKMQMRIDEASAERDELKEQLEAVEATRTDAVNNAVKWANEADEAIICIRPLRIEVVEGGEK